MPRKSRVASVVKGDIVVRLIVRGAGDWGTRSARRNEANLKATTFWPLSRWEEGKKVFREKTRSPSAGERERAGFHRGVNRRETKHVRPPQRQRGAGIKGQQGSKRFRGGNPVSPCRVERAAC